MVLSYESLDTKSLTFYHLLSLALIQGITEFLPISSSGHLILLPSFTNFPDQGLLIDVSVHMGTLLAVVIYFFRDSLSILKGFSDLVTGNRHSVPAQLTKFLIWATIPVIILGLILKITDLIDLLRNIKVIGWTMIIFGIFLYLADRFSFSKKINLNYSIKDALIMGLWQSAALIPGTSRSGATITAARILGYKRKSAARIAMLMSIPTILASGSLEIIDVWHKADFNHFNDAVIVICLSFIFAFLTLTIMMRLLNSISFTPYVIYRILLGVLLLAIAYN
ncbi:MAG: undecaprenyl-diphosphate phosphatase [Paracoccaceae bacterium]|nr:undecaprenyl-diphosphate phosphatase [Paracoccaceae bacterium]